MALADPSPPDNSEAVTDGNWAFKLTPSYYSTSNQPGAADINLRANNGPHAVWLGNYRQGNEFEQARTGYEFTGATPLGTVVPSLQLATHGFLGGSINFQSDGDVFGILGFGRTNGAQYYNLNFDPNDAITFGLGTRLLPKTTLSLFTIKDDRLGTGQTVTHLVWRYLADHQQRWIIDLSTKHGSPSAGEQSVSGGALSVTYDYQSFFVHIARDLKVNFTEDNQTRMALGVRF
jgi:hypothetical protein